ncbi:hypothetical protein HW115_10040 [Verrucomicrobiaceae bacterium N1E253]|uniref:Uncharacterized protein n=1 Tax=Oceaniferula marina TaxID=2748318 RepID=A0A851GEI1_9BACT|nr:hypothetical protein [Oceaniferula marina]NWK55953.1 hypothetical protein [Oceaniferula marina]
MRTSQTRRHFLHRLGWVSGAGLASPQLLLADTSSHRRSGQARRSLQKVLSFVDRYASQSCLCGISAAVEATGGQQNTPVQILACIASTESLTRALTHTAGLPFNQVYADGNQLAFHYSGREYTIFNQHAEEFSQQKETIHRYGVGPESSTAAYAHDYLTWDNQSRKLSDLKRTVVGNKIILKKVLPAGVSYQFQDILKGMLDASILELETPEAILNEWRHTLKNTQPEDPDTITACLLSHLTDLSFYLEEPAIISLLQSPLLAESLRQVLSIRTQDLITCFKQLKPKALRRKDQESLWHAALIAVCPDGANNQTLQAHFLNPGSHSKRISPHATWRRACQLSA